MIANYKTKKFDSFELSETIIDESIDTNDLPNDSGVEWTESNLIDYIMSVDSNAFDITIVTK